MLDALRPGAALLAVMALCAGEAQAQTVARTAGLIVGPSGVATWRGSPVTWFFDGATQLGAPTTIFTGTPPIFRFSTPAGPNAWNQVVISIVAGPGPPDELFVQLQGSTYPQTIGTIENGTAPPCYGSPLSNGICGELNDDPPAGYYVFQADTWTGGSLVGTTYGTIYVGAGPYRPAAASGSLFTLYGESDGGKWSYGLTTGNSLATGGVLDSLGAAPAMKLMDEVPVNGTASLFVTALLSDIPTSFPGYTAVAGPNPSSLSITSPGGWPLYLWVGDHLGRSIGTLGAIGAVRFNPIVQTSPSEIGIWGLDLTNDQLFVADPEDFSTSYVTIASQTAEITCLDFDALGETLWGVTESTHEYGMVHLDDGSFHSQGVLAGLPPNGKPTGTSSVYDAPPWAQPYNGSWHFVLYDPNSNTSELWSGNLPSGNMSLVGTIGSGVVGDVACSFHGEIYGIDTSNDTLIAIDEVTGAGTAIGPLGIDVGGSVGMDFDWATGELYAHVYLGPGSGHFARLDLGTGAATLLADTGVADRRLEIAVQHGEGVPSSGSVTCDCTGGNSPCGTTGDPGHGCPNSSGPAGAALVGAGVPSIGHDTFSLSVSSAAAMNPGLILAGTLDLGPQGLATIPDSAGLLCVGGTTRRGGVAFADASGAASFFDFQGAPFGASDLVSPGASISYTFWFRDPGTAIGCPNDTASADFNFSNGWTTQWLP